ncbi:putative ABC transporter [Byssothecium circinans]|uniref:Putative ABC transporter n=1 Tax=Byssothecium circinans TaxID=147558 RepID=A0A6A5T7K1_9PLEO|nr:putative ABC transporter [Byssothecium circinans]
MEKSDVVDIARCLGPEYEVSSSKTSPRLDPPPSAFSSDAWLKTFHNAQGGSPGSSIRRSLGFAFKRLSISRPDHDGSDRQPTVGSVPMLAFNYLRRVLSRAGQRKAVPILHDLDGLVNAGEMLLVLGPPGSGGSTFLKAVAGERIGMELDLGSHLHYDGISHHEITTRFRGEAIYIVENDIHFPRMTVRQTLEFAASVRAPSTLPDNTSQRSYVEGITTDIAATLGITHTLDTMVGDDLVRGISGGERKRVTIAEAMLTGAPLQCWDNPTRGLDSASTLTFCQSLRNMANHAGTTACVTFYHAPDAVYDLFDRVVVLYEGRQIFLGAIGEATEYFTELGFQRAPRQSSADFLSSMCNPGERVVRAGFERGVPRTPDDFANAWKNSGLRTRLLKDIEQYEAQNPVQGQKYQKFVASMGMQKSGSRRAKSPYIRSYGEQVLLCLKRGFWRLKTDPSLTIEQLVGNTIFCLVISSVFYDLPTTTDSFRGRGVLLFWATLIIAFSSSLEILTLYAQRPIVEKHRAYAFYAPSAEALASALTDLPYKIINTIIFSTILYFMTNLRRGAGAYFFFLLLSFCLTMTMSMIFRTIAAGSRSIAEALAPSSLLMLGLIMYTGFVIPPTKMPGWSRWLQHVNPIAYGFESLVVNEFAGQEYTCSSYVPSGMNYVDVAADQRVCATIGSVQGKASVSGSAYISESFSYSPQHKWRNLGIMLSFLLFFTVTYLYAAEKVQARPKGERLRFLHRRIVSALPPKDVEAGSELVKLSLKPRTRVSRPPSDVERVTSSASFAWSDVSYTLRLKKKDHKILDGIDGFVRPGTLTALMGVSGAGKTTLLDVLSSRVATGVLTGDVFVNGAFLGASFRRKTGYAQQEDLHLDTTTVREALKFSALLRQSPNVIRSEKLAYVEEVIHALGMGHFADAIVGATGDGLNVEQRKRLTIGVELVARPELLFLDEPTSGLDTKTAWSILELLKSLAKSGQSILCTIHQPTALQFQSFDRVLLIQDGKTLYFGDIGENSQTVIEYFTRQGEAPCRAGDNPAEWMMTVTSTATWSGSGNGWVNTWRDSAEMRAVKSQVATMNGSTNCNAPTPGGSDEYAMPFSWHLREMLDRTVQQYWRSPSYIYSRLVLCAFSGLFIGFSFFDTTNDMQGLQNQLLGIFMMYTIFGQLASQSMPLFVAQRSLYEARERKSKTCMWQAFLIASILVEVFWNTVAALIMFPCWYYPMHLYQNAMQTNAVHARGFLMFLLLWGFLLFCATFSSLVIAAMDTAENGGNAANLMFNLSLIFCGVLAGPGNLPRFWIFLYRVSPLTYLIGAMIATGVGNADIRCSAIEFLHLNPPSNATCGAYMHEHIASAGGYLEDPGAVTDCNYCPLTTTNRWLEDMSIDYNARWRNLGIVYVYIVFNVGAALLVYWLVRVPKQARWGRSSVRARSLSKGNA